MIAKTSRFIVNLTRISLRRFTTDSKKPQAESTKDNNSDALIERKEQVQLMDDTYERVKMQGLEDRNITNVNTFQRDILTQNKFDLMHPNIEPKIASISTTMGLQLNQNNYLAEINLGKIKVKKENEVFLSQVDPDNIPEYYDIVFDYEKQMSLVGTKLQGTKDKQQGIENSEMKISTRRAFQQKSQSELSRQILGVDYNPVLNSRLAYKQLLIAIVLTFFISGPIQDIYIDKTKCKNSILQIQGQRMKHVNQLKMKAMVNAIITNPDMQNS